MIANGISHSHNGTPLVLPPLMDDFTRLNSKLCQALEELQKRTGCPITVNKGHKNYGPPMNWSGPPPPRGSEVFVGRLPRDLFEDELVPILERAGLIYEMRLMVDSLGWNRGYAYVRYSSRQEAEEAINLFNNYEIRPNFHLAVMKSVDNNRLFVGGIPKVKQQSELLEEMKRVTEGVTGVILYPDVNDKTKNRGFAFVEYQNHKGASMARQRLMRNPPLLWNTHQVKVDWAEPEIEVDEETMNKVKVLYVRNLALPTTEQQLQDLFSGSGAQIERVRKLKDYAFIHFATREQAEEAKNRFKGAVLDGCQIDISWSKPVTNKEEYQQRKAMSRAMFSGPTPPLTTTISVHGEPFLLNQRIRNAAGTQGFTTKHITKIKQCETPLAAMHPAAILAPNQFLPTVAMKAQIEASLQPFFGLDKLSLPEEILGQSIQDLANQQVLQAPWMTPHYMMPHVNPSWTNQTAYAAAHMQQSQNFIPGAYFVQSPYQATVFDNQYTTHYACPQFYPAQLMTPMPNLTGTTLSVDRV